MAQVNTKDFSTLPVGRLGLIPLQSCSSLGAKVNDWLVKWRAERQYPGMDSFAFEGYKRDSYIIDAKTPRFGSGEGKCTINESVRGDDILNTHIDQLMKCIGTVKRLSSDTFVLATLIEIWHDHVDSAGFSAYSGDNTLHILEMIIRGHKIRVRSDRIG